MTELASLMVRIGADTANLTRGLNTANTGIRSFGAGAKDAMEKLGKGMTDAGTSLGLLSAPFLAFGAVSVNAALNFEESMTNINSILQLTDGEIGALSANILAFGATTRAGPQAVAEAFYDIVGGVADASTHMAILEAATATAEAGNADLGATTSALIAVMNSYGFSAEQAGFASDVLTQAVAMGVGTMDELAAALPTAAGLAATVGIELDNLAASMAWVTTQGFTFSEASTQMTAIMTAFLKPNQAMIAALAAMGIESGSAGLEMYGLAGMTGRLEIALGGSQDKMAAALGTTEALTGAMALNKPEFEEFIGNFYDTTEGATAAARAIQNMSTQAKLDVLKSQVDALTISVGDALLPALGGIVGKLGPVITSFTEWAQANPEHVQRIAELTLGIGALAAGLVIVGTTITAVTTVFGALGTAVGLVSWPVLALGAALAGLVAIWNALGPGLLASWGEVFRQIGIFIQNVIDKVAELIAALGSVLPVKGPRDTSNFDAYLQENMPGGGGGGGGSTWVDDVVGQLPGHAGGLSFVPHDNYVARLHKGEAVLTANQNRAQSSGSRSGGGAVININGGIFPNGAQEFAEYVKTILQESGY